MIDSESYFFLKEGVYVKTPITDIIYVKSDDNYCRFYLKDRVLHVMRDTLSQVEERLSRHSFYRCHRQYIVNLNRIERINTIDRTVILEEDHEVPYSRSRKKELIDMITKL